METATTESYTYCPTLSLHDVLPIWPLPLLVKCLYGDLNPFSLSLMLLPEAFSSSFFASGARPGIRLFSLSLAPDFSRSPAFVFFPMQMDPRTTQEIGRAHV